MRLSSPDLRGPQSDQVSSSFNLQSWKILSLQQDVDEQSKVEEQWSSDVTSD